MHAKQLRLIIVLAIVNMHCWAQPAIFTIPKYPQKIDSFIAEQKMSIYNYVLDDQFPSPYTGMGNDPVNNIDEDGGWSSGLTGALIGAAVGFAAPYAIV